MNLNKVTEFILSEELEKRECQFIIAFQQLVDESYKKAVHLHGESLYVEYTNADGSIPVLEDIMAADKDIDDIWLEFSICLPTKEEIIERYHYNVRRNP